MYGLFRMIPMMACAVAVVVVDFYQASVASAVCRSSQTTLDRRDVVEKTLHLCRCRIVTVCLVCSECQ
jgi:hypothetical protein